MILGAGLVGIELGIHLARGGKQVTVVEMADQINDGGNFLHMAGTEVELKKQNIQVHLHTKAKEITPQGVVCEAADGPVVYAADTVIYAVGMRSLHDEMCALNYCAPEFYPIGDCIGARNITSAVTEGYMTARNIGRF